MAYGTHVDISCSILAHYDTSHSKSSFISPETQTLILWVVDGLGYTLMEQEISQGLLRHYSHHPGNHQPRRLGSRA